MATVEDMANAREARAGRQRELLEAYASPLISFTMNIAGPIKTTPLIRAGFAVGRERILYTLRVLGAEVLAERTTEAATGSETILCFAGDAATVKAAMVGLEEADPIGRLWDIDVLTPDGCKLERRQPRLCLLCGQQAALCARSRTHSAAELFARAEQLLRAFFEQEAARQIAEDAVRAVLYELLVTPKPGLVDRRNNGAHTDMDVFTFAASAAGLFPYFETCALRGIRCADGSALFEQLRAPGVEAERRMLAATGGVNTHKGAIFSLGVLCAASGVLLGQGTEAAPAPLSRTCASMVRGPLEAELRQLSHSTARTAGQRMYQQTGMTGARGEAAGGYPTAVAALDVLERAEKNGSPLNDAGVAALLSILTRAEDSNFVKRSSPQRRQEWIEQIRAMQGDGAVACAALLDERFIAENISPGGSADLLAAAFFMQAVQGENPIPALYR